MELILINGCKSKKILKTRYVKINKSRKYVLRGERNVRYYDRNLSNEKKSNNLI